MCEFSGKLIAWLDGELPAVEAAEVGRHLRGCAECRGEMAVFEKLSGALGSYCEAAGAVCEQRGRQSHWKQGALGVGAAAIAAVIVLVVLLPRASKMHPSGGPAPSPAKVRTNTVEEAVNAAESPAVAAKAGHRRIVASPARTEASRGQLAEPEIQITIPADAVLPPGAVPEGVSYVADVRIPANGSAQPLFVWP